MLLTMPDYEKEFQLEINASNIGFGATLAKR